MKIGIPKALLYYKQSPLWLEFFKNLGQEIVISDDTDISILNEGGLAAPSESCLPVKIFYGHVKSLRNVDYVFIPRVVSVEGMAYTCPKFLGLPDLIEACEEMPPVLTATFDYRNNRKDFYKSVMKLGSVFTRNPGKIINAYRTGLARLTAHENELLKKEFSGNLNIAVVGHPYNLFDRFASINLIERLGNRGFGIMTQENLTKKQINDGASSLQKDLFWTYEKEVVGGALHFLKSPGVDGVIYMLSFACGPDSLMQCIIENKAKQAGNKPLLSLVVDEHSSETGLLTRVEAFVDMLERRKQ